MFTSWYWVDWSLSQWRVECLGFGHIWNRTGISRMRIGSKVEWVGVVLCALCNFDWYWILSTYWNRFGVDGRTKHRLASNALKLNTITTYVQRSSLTCGLHFRVVMLVVCILCSNWGRKKTFRFESLLFQRIGRKYPISYWCTFLWRVKLFHFESMMFKERDRFCPVSTLG